jgi:Holliday junction resolvase
MTSNKKNGTDFEREFCKLASSYGFWAHRLNEGKTGEQPADVILCRNNIPALIDCKVCENDVFRLSRIEENQELSMGMWIKKGNPHAYFALKLNNIEEVCLIYYFKLYKLKTAGKTQLNKEEILFYGTPFSLWQELI